MRTMMITILSRILLYIITMIPLICWCLLGLPNLSESGLNGLLAFTVVLLALLILTIQAVKTINFGFNQGKSNEE